MTNLILPIIIMLVLIMAEACLLQLKEKVKINWKDIIFNLNSGHLMLWLFRGLEVFCYHYVYTHFSFNLLVQVNILLIWVFTLFAWDLCFYWEHRLSHKLPFLWAIHMVHHQGEHFNLSLAVRNSWYSALGSIPFFAVLALIGVPTEIFVTVSIFHYSIQFFNHNALTPKLGFLESIFVTPHHHRVHHLKNHYYSNTNYSGSFIFWDKIFGSFETAPKDKEIPFGSYGSLSNNPFWASTLPFMNLFKIRYKPPVSQKHLTSSSSLVSGGLILFALAVDYIFDYGYGYENINVLQYILFFTLVLGSIALGGIAESKNWGVIAWFIIGWFTPLFFIILSKTTTTFYWQFFMWLIALHGTILFILWLKGNLYEKTTYESLT